MTTNDEMMTAAWRAFQAGDLDRAEQAYRQVLNRIPTAAHAWYMLGATCQVRGRIGSPWRTTGKPSGSSPDFPEACNNLGVALHALRRGEEAIERSAGPWRSGRSTRKPTTTWATCCTSGRARRGRGLLSTGDRPQSRLCGGPPQPRQCPAFRAADGRGDRELRRRPGADARPRHRPPEPVHGTARDGGLPAGMARVRVAAEMLAVRASRDTPSRSGTGARSTAGRSCSTPTPGWGMRSSLSGMPRWSANGAAG